MTRGVAQLASALAWGARGRKFESSHPDESKRKKAVMKITAFFCSRFKVQGSGFKFQVSGFRFHSQQPIAKLF